MAEALKNYRHDVTGLIGRYHPRVAAASGHLIEVRPDAKPLAYTPIPKEAVEKIVASQAAEKATKAKGKEID